MIKSFQKDKLTVRIYPDKKALGVKAAEDAAEKMNRLLENQEYITAIFAAAPSQDDFLENLVKQDIPWNRVVALHMDEYTNFDSSAPQAFSRYLADRLFSKVKLRECHLFDAGARDVEAERLRYAEMIRKYPVSIAFIGIGENGHIAFNDPGCDLYDKESVKKVELPLTSRQQQVNDGCFASLDQVPTMALTVTIPPILAAKHVLCMVPGTTKASAVKQALSQSISGACPATILRNHDDAVLYLDTQSASEIE